MGDRDNLKDHKFFKKLLREEMLIPINKKTKLKKKYNRNKRKKRTRDYLLQLEETDEEVFGWRG